MKTARPLTAFALLGSALMFACASGDGGTGGGGSGGTGPTTTAPATTGVGTTVAGVTTGTGVTSSGTGGTCAPQCTADADCEQTCAMVPAGESNCCDTQTSMCYVNNFSTCPPPNTTTSTSGVGGSQY